MWNKARSNSINDGLDSYKDVQKAEKESKVLTKDYYIPCVYHTPGFYTHLKIVFGKKPKTILPEYNCNQDLVFWKAKNQTGFSINEEIDHVLYK